MSSDSNPCVLLHGPEHSSISTTYLPIPQLSNYPPDYILLKIAYVGVCGSDVHFYLHGGVGSDARKYAQFYCSQAEALPTSRRGSSEFEGLVMGHEASATVARVGKDVKRLKVGDKVAIEPGIPCRTCARCVEGRYNLCFGMRFAASFREEVDREGHVVIRQTPGALSRYYVLPEHLCYKLPEHVQLDDGVLVEPLAVAVHACRLAGVMKNEAGRGSSGVVVMGAGTIGLVSSAVACAFGAGRVVVVDVAESRLEFAKQWLTGQEGAATKAGVEVHVYRSEPGLDAAANAKRLIETCGLEGGADVVLEASGVPSATAMGIYVLRTGGDMVQTGLSKKPTMDGFPITDLSEKEVHLHGAFRYKHGDFEIATDLLGRGLVGQGKALINEVFSFERYEDAWKATRDGKGVKNLIRVGQD